MRGFRRRQPEGHAEVEPVPNARRYEALGRVMAALSSEAEVRDACRDLMWWRAADESWHVEWGDGPYASEVADLVIERVREPGVEGGLAGPSGLVTPTTANLDVMGVGFLLRAVDPLGLERLRTTPGLWRMSASIEGGGEPGGRTGSRRDWEELLGG
ncbi:hypothetical protein [Microtetraspora sp. AC03309]|uniref:hypothetical protein n=1 Tax=Microtetraspora sp. AC03309 TaxID=2779376 RepID=UPI001E4A221F|nr:hypothetical protein [Microtetraspora sp. AC03309]